MTQTATVSLDTERTIGEISPLLFGGFAEHMGRCVYGGIFEPGSALSDAHGLRRDVLEALREVGYTTIRYPGGNFVSGYRWQDGIGPKDQRPTRRELAWRSIETNQFGTDEFMHFCRQLGAEPMLAVNLGTGGPQDAADLFEYVNAPTGTRYADLRAANGHAQPYNVGLWCLGNEMDGPWQIGALEAYEYGLKAQETAKLLKVQDENARLILCGSSNTMMPTYPEWDRVALETCWDKVDYLSLHYYADNDADDTPSYLALARQFEDQLDTLAATLRYVKAKRRSRHEVYLSWDEWNVWYKDRSGDGGWQVGPRLSEEVYNLEDALVVAQWLNVFLRRCDVLKIACIAQIVNTISPLTTSSEGLLRHPTFYPLAMFARNASGVALDVLVHGPSHETRRFGEVPLLDVSSSFDQAAGRGAVFLVNRSLTDALEVTIRWQSGQPRRVESIQQLSGMDPKATNSFAHPDTVVPQALPVVSIMDHQAVLTLPPLSLTMLKVQY